SIRSHLGEILNSCQSTFKETSFDKQNKEYLCSDVTTAPVYDFDQYVRTLDREKTPASPDAIYLGNKVLYFVEFKNSVPSDIKTPEIKAKFRDGTNILIQLLNVFTPKDVRFVFCVVYKAQQSKYFGGTAYIESLAVKFGLNEFNKELGSFYDEVITQDVEFYKKAHASLLSCG
ncbi:MAG TPA: hypothetical protein PK283_07820, partial [Thiotrichales bacterium]|nr:hypothetical protein [Thiotrichales bacterium]